MPMKLKAYTQSDNLNERTACLVFFISLSDYIINYTVISVFGSVVCVCVWCVCVCVCVHVVQLHFK